MSYEAMHKVRASGLTDRTQVDVLEALAFFHNKETGACFPSTEAIARVSRVNDRTVRLTLKALHELGFVSSIQKPGQKRYFTLHLDRLPVAELLQESTPLYESAPLQEITGEGCKNLQETPVKNYREPLQKLTPEQGINKEYNKINNKVCIAPSAEPLENLVKDTPENGTTVVPKTVHDSINTLSTTQSCTQSIDAPAPDDLFTNDGQMVEKPKKSRAKPKTQCPFSPDEQIPDEYLAYAKEKHPSVDAPKEFRKFVNSAYANGRKYSDWKAAWRTWTANAEDWKPKTTYTPRSNAPLRFDDAYYGDGSF